MKINVQEFDTIAREIFAPVYPVIARQIIDRTGITKGICLDIGSGGGYLGLALARETDLFFRFLDESPEMLEIAQKNIADNDLTGRAETLQGNVEAIPLPDESVNLAISRGSVFFWEDRAKAFREIYRVLAPSGYAYIGGGFGSAKLLAEISETMDAMDKGSGRWRKKVARNLGPHAPGEFEAALQAAGIPDFEISHSEETGLWAIFRK
ncbi:SAM-dependent methyltransferase [Desulfonema ishimotonii]|uniref:SAM-dependent methyltransferase n=1 Tax=Desulfonema ishimotonii TaxID=45657 RepID=A0A401FR97_9BACT|nr:class I SAM-dependent methyltransferase [Desulfonema ishimotonii]GBC59487.1 SAM-dependent methyltransferase [Desulfonema ishimotonii]